MSQTDTVTYQTKITKKGKKWDEQGRTQRRVLEERRVLEA